MHRQRSRRYGFTLIEMMVVITILAVLMLILLPNYVKAKSRSRLNACESNIRTMVTATEMYSRENNNAYAPTLNALVPTYLRSIPRCPSAPDSTSYTAGYTAASNSYTVACQGSYHTDLGLPDDFPRYLPDEGLREQ